MGWRDFLGVGIKAAPAQRSAAAILSRPPRRGSSRGWDPAENGRLFASWITSNLHPDEEVRKRQEVERSRSRELERANAWANKYFALYRTNVFGEQGIRLVPRVMMPDPKRKDRLVPDRDANQKIRDAWKRWGAHGEPTVCGRLSFVQAQKIIGTSFKRDGECFIRLHRGARHGAFGFRIQPLEADHVPISMNRPVPGGGEIRMGIERDVYERPVAYWIQRQHPGSGSLHRYLDQFDRIPADEIIHIYDPKRIAQTRGLPHLEAGIAALHMQQGYEEAELVAARAASSKMGWITSETGTEYTGEGELEVSDEEIPQTFEPGIIGQLGRDQSFVGFDPQHPNGAFASFIKSKLRGFAAVTGASYNSVADDLEAVNFSSLRAGLLAERAVWKEDQAFFAEVVLEPVYRAFLEAALLSQQIALPVDLERFGAHRWQGRRWEWVDPVKEAKGAETELDNLTSTITEIAEEKGREPREIFEEIRAEIDLATEFELAELLPYLREKRAAAPVVEGSE